MNVEKIFNHSIIHQRMNKDDLLKTKREIVSHLETEYVLHLKRWRLTKVKDDLIKAEVYWTLLSRMGHADYKKSQLINKSFNS